jgi:hypothetical protein
LATELVNWRSEMNMAELKGGGESATISGWKASVRKRANKIGLEDVAAIVPADQPVVRAPRRVQLALNQMARMPSKSLEPTSIPQVPDDNLSYPGVLFGRSRRRINVQDHTSKSHRWNLQFAEEMPLLTAFQPLLFYIILSCLSEIRRSFLRKRPFLCHILGLRQVLALAQQTTEGLASMSFILFTPVGPGRFQCCGMCPLKILQAREGSPILSSLTDQVAV